MLRAMMFACLAALHAVADSSTGHFSIEDMLQPKQAANQPVTIAGATPVSSGVTPQPGAPVAATVAPATGLGAMQAILGMGAAGAASSAPLGSGHGGQALSVETMDIVNGIITAFMHNVQLFPGEKTCLENNIAQLTGDVTGTVQDAVTAIKAAIKSKGKGLEKKSQGNLVSVGVDAAMKIASLATLATNLVKGCVKGDALQMLNTVGQHIINGQYLGRTFLVNGVDIAHSLADSIISFEAKNYKQFGTDIGTAFRKILLSNAINGTRALPEGVPEQKIIEQVTAGVMSGFFARGTEIEITDKSEPDVDIQIDLHQCIARNEGFFKEIWFGLWDLFAQLALNGQQHGFGMQPQNYTGQPKWQGELMMALMQVPMALQLCGLGPQAQSMFMEAIRSLNDVHVKFVVPNDRIEALPASNKMAKAVAAWTQWDFATFGKELGMLLRELVMLAFPEKYSVDSQGRLHRDLLGYSSQSRTVLGSKQSSPFLFTLYAGCAMSVLAALVAVRRIHSTQSPTTQNNDFSMEDGLCEVEELE